MKSINEINLASVLKDSVQSRQPSVSFEQVWDLHTSRKKNSWSSKPKKMIALVAISLIILPTLAFAVYNQSWSNININLSLGKSDQMDYSGAGTRFKDGYYDYLVEIPKKNPDWKLVDSFSEAEKVATFPLRQPSDINGWRVIHKIGLVLDGNLKYTDIYENDKGSKIIIEQEYDSMMTKAMTGEKGKYNKSYLPDAEIVRGFGDDLAVLMDVRENRKLLSILHTETDQVTRFDLWGENTDITTLKSFYLAYMQSPGKQGLPPNKVNRIISGGTK